MSLNLFDGQFGHFAFRRLNLKIKITIREHKKIFCGPSNCVPSKIFKNILWPISIFLKYFMTPANFAIFTEKHLCWSLFLIKLLVFRSKPQKRDSKLKT